MVGFWPLHIVEIRKKLFSATEIALEAGATVVVISTGGILAGMPEIYSRCYLIPSVGRSTPTFSIRPYI